jgi:hypothetical protein
MRGTYLFFAVLFDENLPVESAKARLGPRITGIVNMSERKLRLALLISWWALQQRTGAGRETKRAGCKRKAAAIAGPTRSRKKRSIIGLSVRAELDVV